VFQLHKPSPASRIEDIHRRYRACGPGLCDTAFQWSTKRVTLSQMRQAGLKYLSRIPSTWKNMEGIFMDVQHFLFFLFLVCEAQSLQYLQWRSHDLPVPNNFSYKSWESWPVSFPPSLPFTLSPQRPVFTCQCWTTPATFIPGPWGSHQGKHSTWVLLADLPAQSCASIHASG